MKPLFQEKIIAKCDTQLVSIYLPYYNDKDFLHEVIQSVLEQTYKNFQFVLFNHASTDGSRDIARSFYDERIIHIDTEENLGAGSGLNFLRSLFAMSGKYFKILCADDVLEPICIEKLVCYLEENQDKAIVYSDAAFIGKNGIKKEGSWFEKTNFLDYDEKEMLKVLFQRRMPPCFSASLFKMDDIKSIKMDKSFIIGIDAYILATLLIKGKRIGYIKEPLVKYRIHEDNMGPSNMLFGFSSVESYKLALHIQQCSFEALKAIDVFYDLKDITIAKHIMPFDKFSQKLEDADSCLIPFVIAHYLLDIPDHYGEFASCHYQLICSGYMKMYELMDDDAIREKIEKKFEFGIAEFREMYATKLISVVSVEDYLNITNSRTWRYGRKIAVIIRKFFPKGSRRTRIARIIWKRLQAILS